MRHTVSRGQKWLKEFEEHPPPGSKVVKSPAIAEDAGRSVTTILKLEVLESGKLTRESYYLPAGLGRKRPPAGF